MHKILVISLRGIMILFGKLPLSFHYAMAGVFKWLLKDVLRYRKEVIFMNLARSFPEKKYWELKDIADEYYSHMARIIVEAIWFGACDKKRIEDSNICRVVNPEFFKQCYEQSDASLTVLYSHCGNWEVLGGIKQYYYGLCPFDEDNLYVVYKKLSNEVWNEVFYKNRQYPIKGFKGQLESNNVLRFMLKNRSQKAVYMANVDQSPYEAGCPIGKFMNQNTEAMMAMANISKKLKMPVLYMTMKETGIGHYDLEFTSIWDGVSEISPEEMMRKYYDLLEKEIIEVPHNYLWSHNRWKL